MLHFGKIPKKFGENLARFNKKFNKILAKFAKILKKSAKISKMHFRKMHFRKMHFQKCARPVCDSVGSSGQDSTALAMTSHLLDQEFSRALLIQQTCRGRFSAVSKPIFCNQIIILQHIQKEENSIFFQLAASIS